MQDSAFDSDAWVERLRAGEENALAMLFDAYRPRLWRIVRFRLDARLHSRVDPDDVLQEAYLDAAQRVEHFLNAEGVSFFVWLRQVVQQTLIDVHRRHLGAAKRDAGREVSIHGAPQATSISLAAHLLGAQTTPSQAAIRDEQAGQLEAAIAGMDAIDQEVLALRHFEELSNREVAEVLNIQQKAASIRYIRAVARLKKILVEIPGYEDLR